MRRYWRRVLAWWRWDLAAVCAVSDEAHEYHDYPDSTTPEPWHLYTHTCRRCGRRFQI